MRVCTVTGRAQGRISADVRIPVNSSLPAVRVRSPQVARQRWAASLHSTQHPQNPPSAGFVVLGGDSVKLPRLPDRLAPPAGRVETSGPSAPRTWADSRAASSSARGYGAAWRKLRADILRRDRGLCIPCQRAGRVSAAAEVDHVIGRAQWSAEGRGPAGCEAGGNLQAICTPCHKAKTALESAAARLSCQASAVTGPIRTAQSSASGRTDTLEPPAAAPAPGGHPGRDRDQF